MLLEENNWKTHKLGQVDVYSQFLYYLPQFDENKRIINDKKAEEEWKTLTDFNSAHYF